MQLLRDNIGEVVVITASIAFAGVLLKAFSDWFTSSRSKYVDVIAAERIKWVGELRSDFLDFFMCLDNMAHQFRSKNVDHVAADRACKDVNRLINLIRLKLNLESALDNTILSLMGRAAYLARIGQMQEYVDFRRVLTDYSSYLLKDEWEKAKREASGPMRRLGLAWRRKRRQLMRRRFAERPLIKPILEKSKVALSCEEQLKLLDEAPPQKGDLSHVSESDHGNNS